jgi:hypothetical protein
MEEIPDEEASWQHYNNFHLTSDTRQMSRIMSHYELYKMTRDVPGEIVECGVFKGASLMRFAMFREVFGDATAKELIGFDTYDTFPEPEFEPDKQRRKDFIDEAGSESISVEQLTKVFTNKDIDNYDLIVGNVNNTVPDYVEDNPELRISLLNIDIDVYGATKTILEELYPRVVPGGLILFDDYGKFPGETKAVDEFFCQNELKIRRLPFAEEPPYVVKNDN